MSDRQFIALAYDPAPGEPPQIAEMAEKYRAVGKELGEGLNSLNQIIKQQGVWEGEASEAFARRVGDLPDYLDTASRSMSEAAKVLDQWQLDLVELQRQAWELEMRAREAKEKAVEAQNNPDLQLANRTFPDEQSLNLAQRLLDEAGRKLDEAIGRYDEVIAATKRLVEQHQSTAEAAAKQLDHARELAPDEPGLLGKMFGDAVDVLNDLGLEVLDAHDAAWDLVQDNAEVISKVSDVVGDIGNVVGIVSDFLPPPPGPIASAISAGLGLTALAGHGLAHTAGADVATETLVFDALGAGTALAGIFTPPGADTTMRAIGYTLVGSQMTGEGIAATMGKSFEGPIGDFKNYWMPKNETQWHNIGLGVASGGTLLPIAAAGNAFWNAAEIGYAADQKPENVHKRNHDKVWS